MSTKILSGLYGAVDLTSPVSTLSVTATGYVQDGVAATGISRYTVVNAGHITNQNTTSGNYWGLYLKGGGVVTNSGVIRSFSPASGGGVVLDNGGTVTNTSGGLVLGYSGIEVGGQSGSVINDGTVIGSGEYGAALLAGGVVDNGSASATNAVIQGKAAVIAKMSATLHNYGRILGAGTTGVGGYLMAGGLITNGTSTDRTASITGYIAAVGATTAALTIQNYGALRATSASGVAVVMGAGGTVTNGSSADTSATIRANAAAIACVGSAAATVVNFGSVAGGYASGVYGAIYMKDGGSVTNGSNADTTASLTGQLGAGIGGASGTVANFGTIGGAAAYVGVVLADGGQVTNGSAADTTALIEGAAAVGGTTAPVTVTNFGTLEGTYTPPTGSLISTVFLAVGGTLTNGSSTDSKALITGNVGVYASSGAVGTVTNFGSIEGITIGVVLDGGGRITNGSASDTTADISGALYGAVIESGGGTVSNFGTIIAGEIGQSVGAATGPGALINGGATDHVALIQGYTGAEGLSGGKITNYGTIAGSTGVQGVGVNLQSGSSLTNEAGALIEGYNGLRIAATDTAINFGTISSRYAYGVRLVAGARFDMEAGSVVVGVVLASTGLVDAVSGTSDLTGLQTSGIVEGAGTISLSGFSILGPGVSLKVAEIAVSGSSTEVSIDTKLTDAETWDQMAGDLVANTGYQITFKGKSDSFSGTISGGGTVEFDTGTDSLSNVTLGAGLTKLAGAATVTLSGAIDVTGPVDLDGGVLTIAAAGASLSGGGLITLTTTGTNIIKGANSAAVLTNADTIKAAGQVGDGVMSLVNSGTIESDFTKALTLDTGAKTVVNSGLIEAIGSGGLVVASAVDNTGTLMSNNANLTLEGVITGAGSIKVDGGKVICEAAMNEAVRFGSTGRLILADSRAFTASITGFSTTGTTSLDLEDIDFTGASASYSGTATSGILTVTDGTHTAKIHLTGNYMSSTWHLSNDGSGGTVVVDPTAPAASAAPPHALIAAQASFGAAPASQSTADPVHTHAATLLIATTHG